MKRSFERDRQFQNENRKRRQQDINDSWLNWTLCIMLVFCMVATLINGVMK